jgi:hypothetical protein
MVDKQIVLDTIKKMLNAGLQDSVIVSTLKDVGLKESEIASYLAEAKGKPVGATTTAFASSVTSGVAASPQFSVDESEEEQSVELSLNQQPQSQQQHQENVLLHTTTHAALESSSGQLQEILQKLVSIEQKMNAIASLPLTELNAKIVNYDKRIAGITTEIADLKSQTSALRDILEKVLDTNRSVLQELESKKN